MQNAKNIRFMPFNSVKFTKFAQIDQSQLNVHITTYKTKLDLCWVKTKLKPFFMGNSWQIAVEFG